MSKQCVQLVRFRVWLRSQRPTISLCIARIRQFLLTVESRDFVERRRGLIVVRERRGLVALTRGIYGVAEAEQERLTGWKSLKKS